MVWSVEKFENNMRTAETQWKTQITKHIDIAQTKQKEEEKIAKSTEIKELETEYYICSSNYIRSTWQVT